MLWREQPVQPVLPMRMSVQMLKAGRFVWGWGWGTKGLERSIRKELGKHY